MFSAVVGLANCGMKINSKTLSTAEPQRSRGFRRGLSDFKRVYIKIPAEISAGILIGWFKKCFLKKILLTAARQAVHYFFTALYPFTA